MGEVPRREAAHRAGVDPEYVDRLVELEILKPKTGDRFSTGDVLRARWLHSLDVAGVPLEGMAAAVRDGTLTFDYLDASAFDRFGGLSGETFEELSERTGIPLDLLTVIREAVGYAEPHPEDRLREDELSLVPTIELMLELGFRPVVIKRWLRVCADSLRRIAETETNWWRTEVEEPLIQGGMTEREMLEAQADVGSQVTPLAERALVAMYHAQQEHAWSKSALEDVEGALERAGLHDRVRRPAAISFLDISGYTRLTEERGDDAAAELAEQVAALARRSSLEHGGQPVKWLGDGVMFHFPDPGAGVVAGLEMVARIAEHALPPARVGIDAGPVVFQEGDYFGRTVNVAARIGEYARPGEVLVTKQVMDATDGTSVTFTDVGPVELKGVSGPVHLHMAHRGLPRDDAKTRRTE
jgi:class 3 adenylate cyclase